MTLTSEVQSDKTETPMSTELWESNRESTVPPIFQVKRKEKNVHGFLSTSVSYSILDISKQIRSDKTCLSDKICLSQQVWGKEIRTFRGACLFLENKTTHTELGCARLLQPTSCSQSPAVPIPSPSHPLPRTGMHRNALLPRTQPEVWVVAPGRTPAALLFLLWMILSITSVFPFLIHG